MRRHRYPGSARPAVWGSEQCQAARLPEKASQGMHQMGRSVVTPVRAEDGGRDTCLEQLSGHYAAGRLPLAELHRVRDRALRAHTVTDVAELLDDLPGPRTHRLPRGSH